MRTVENNGYSTLWYPESRGFESMSLAAFLLSSSEKLVIGSSIANIYARDSFTAQRALANHMRPDKTDQGAFTLKGLYLGVVARY